MRVHSSIQFFLHLRPPFFPIFHYFFLHYLRGGGAHPVGGNAELGWMTRLHKGNVYLLRYQRREQSSSMILTPSLLCSTTDQSHSMVAGKNHFYNVNKFYCQVKKGILYRGQMVIFGSDCINVETYYLLKNSEAHRPPNSKSPSLVTIDDIFLL